MIYSLTVKRSTFISFVLFACGFILLILSIFAEAIGLDKNPGNWSRARIAVFFVGILFICLAGIYYRFNPQIAALISRIWPSIQQNKVIILLSKYEFIKQPLRMVSSYAFTVPIPVLILVLYVWLASSGTWTKWISPTNYYASLANGFKNGTLAVDKKPSPQLLELENPYDMDSWTEDIRIPVDMSYYNGNYYLYWGPVPSLIIFFLNPLYDGKIGDLQITFVFTYGIFLCLYVLIISMWDSYYRGLPKWMLQISLLVAGFASPFTFMLATYRGGRIYEAAITSGAFFLMAGYIFIISALNKPGLSAVSRLFTGGMLWAFSFGSRLPLILPIGLIALIIIYSIFKQEHISYLALLKIAALCIPLGISMAGIGWYNWARFDSITETGQHYQFLTDGYLRNFSEWIIFDPIYIPQNLFNYIVNPITITKEFPFFFPKAANDLPLFSSYPLPEVYAGQWTTGIIWTSPFTLLALLPIIKLLKGFRANKLLASHNQSLDWIIGILTIGFLGAFAPLLVHYWSAMRYQADFMPFLLTLSIIGFWQGYKILKLKPYSRKVFAVIGVGLAIVTIVSSSLLALAANDARLLLLGIFN